MILTFRQADAELIRICHKTATIRMSQQASRCKVGERLTLACGNRMRPTTYQAICTRVEHFDLTEPMIALGRKLEHDPDAAIEASGATCDEIFLIALGESYSILDNLLSEAAEREAQFCTAIWWRLTSPAELREAA